MGTKIEWCDETWNPITGCTPISEVCKNCYAEKMAKRLAGRFGYPKDDPFQPGVRHRNKFHQPRKWKKPRRIFVCSMGDLFHGQVFSTLIDDLFFIMKTTPQHIYMILTKRPEQARIYFNSYLCGTAVRRSYFLDDNIWLGVTAENQEQADKRIPILLQIPAAVRFVSVEPMLSPVDISQTVTYWDDPASGIDWVICGAETGNGKRKMRTEWAEQLRDQCAEAEIPFFFKKDSAGRHDLGGRVYEQFPTGGKNGL